MGIFRGTGGTGDSTTDTTVTTVTEKAAEAASSATSAANSATSAANSASSASTSATNAATSETNAANSATASATSATASETAKTASQAAQTAAETAETNAETAEANAVTAKNQAESARDNAQTAQTAAETAETNAETAYADTLAIYGSTTDVQNAVNSASASATTATTKAAEAATSATNAANSATSAGTSETNAASSASQAATFANTAGSHATDAETAKNAAETAQAAAEAAEANINGLYLGSLANDPTLDGNGVAVTTGDLYFNTTENEVRVYTDNDEWIAVIEAGGDATFNSLTSNNNVVVKGNLEVQGTTITVDSATAQTIDLGDNDKIRFGDGDDLQIYHDGTKSYISDQGTGNLKIIADNLVLTNAAETNTYFVGDGSTGGVNLKYGNATKFDTTSSGVAITGNITVSGTVDGRDIAADGTTLDAVASTYVDVSGDTLSGDLAFGDNVKAKFGASDDLQIYHDGSASVISEQGTGSLIVKTSAFSLQNAAGSEFMGIASENSGVYLYFDGSQKLQTTSSGVDITGTVVADKFEATSTSFLESTNLQLSAGFPRLILLENDTTNLNSRISHQNGALRIETLNDAGTTGTKRLDIDHSTGDISFYEDTGTTAKLTWDASAEELQFKDSVKAEFGDGGDFQIEHNGTNTKITNNTGTLKIVQNANDGDVEISSDNGSGATALYFVADGSTGEAKLYHYGSEKLSTKSTGIDVYDRASLKGSLPVFNLQDTDGTNQLTQMVQSGADLNIRLRNDTVGGTLRVSGFGGGTDTSRLKVFGGGDISFYSTDGISQDFYWDASTSRLGLGTTSPSSDLHIAKSSSVIRMEDTDNNSYGMIVYNTASGGLLLRSDHNQLTGTSGSNIIFQTDGSEVARFDSNGRLGIGTTSPASPLQVDRASTDGDIVTLSKDGTTIGSIGVDNTDNIFLSGNSTHSGLMVGTESIVPYSNGATTDATEDLGVSSIRWRNLYLSGGVYLGGTGSANLLDDYEEGTWTPSFNGYSTGFTGKYTKIGNIIHCRIERTTSIPSSSITGSVTITGLPFVAQRSYTPLLGHIRAASSTRPFGIVRNSSIGLVTDSVFGSLSYYNETHANWDGSNLTQNGTTAVYIAWEFKYRQG